MELTDKEFNMLATFIEEGMDVTGAETADQVKEDNMTWLNTDDLMIRLDWSKQAIGGVMGQLEAKGLIVDSGESPNYENSLSDWHATCAGIDFYFRSFAVDDEPAPYVAADGRLSFSGNC